MNPFLVWLIVVRAYVVEIVRAVWLWALLAVCILSSLATVLRSHHAYLDAHDRYELELQERQRLRFAPVGPGGRAIEPTLRVLRQPNPVSVLVAGVERAMPSGWDFGPSGAEALPTYPSQPSLVSLDVLTDGESVIRLFGGLLGLALGFWLVTRDQQRGWLAASSSYHTAPWWPVSALLVAGLLTLAFIALIWMVTLHSGARWLFGPAQSLDFAFFGTWLFVWVYLVTLFGVGAAVARVTANSLTGTAVSVGIWTFAILMAPQLLSAVLYLAADIPPRARFEYERREAYADRARAAEATLAKRINAAVPDAPTPQEFDKLAEAAYPAFEGAWLSDMADARAEINARTLDWLSRQDMWLARLEVMARFSPATLLQSALANVNGLGWSTRRWWEQAVYRHEAALNSALFDDVPVLGVRLTFRGGVVQWAYIRHPALSIAKLPSFDEPSGASVRHRRIHRADAAAAFVQVVLVLLVAALYPARTEQ